MFQKKTPPSVYVDEPGASEDRPKSETVVGVSVQVEGNFVSEGDVVVKGTVNGSVRAVGSFVSEAGSKVTADVEAGNAFIAGEVSGDIKVENALEIASTARVSGNIFCASLSVQAGALLAGKIGMSGFSAGEKISLSDSGARSRRSAGRRSSRGASSVDESGSTVDSDTEFEV